jgi:radical SAM superfamily enzyme YgiQ (UPF0313 family)
MNILMVSPRTPDTFWSFRHAMRIIGRKAAFPPLGLLTVAAMLPSSWRLRVIDLNVHELTDDQIRWADAVMISAMLVHEPSVREVIARCRAIGRRVIGGGPLFTTCSDRFPDIDCCVIGEAEEIINDLTGDLEAGRLKPRYEAPRKPDVSLTPLPRWDLIDVRDYATLSVQSSRGCPFDCEFCDITAIYGRTPRVKSPDQMVAELEAIRATGWRNGIFMVDDNFIGNKVKAKDVLRAIVAWRERTGCRLTFTTEASINLVDDPELMSLLVQAGFKHVFIGIESPQEQSLKECRKVQNTKRDLIASVRKIHQAGIQVMAGFIVGFDSDTDDIFERQRAFISEAGVVTAMVGLLNALPGTRLFTRLTNEGRLLRSSSGNNLDALLNFVPTLDPTTLTEGYRRLVKELYSPREYYRRVLTFLESYRPARRGSLPPWDDIAAFLRSLWIMGVEDSARWEFWKFLGRSWAKHPAAFFDAVELAIRGHHFRTVAAEL